MGFACLDAGNKLTPYRSRGRWSLKQLLRLIVNGIMSGILLILLLKVVQVSTGNQAYVLLFNFDYIPVIQDLRPVSLYGFLFHFVTCVASVVVLYYLLKLIKRERTILPYVFVYSIGGGILFSLTALSDQPPAFHDFAAWVYWTAAHAVFGVSVGLLVKHWK